MLIKYSRNKALNLLIIKIKAVITNYEKDIDNTTDDFSI